MSRNEVKIAILKELKCRPLSCPAVAIEALIEDFGGEVKEALQELRRERLVRLVAIGDPLGVNLDACIRGEGEIFSEVELRD